MGGIRYQKCCSKMHKCLVGKLYQLPETLFLQSIIVKLIRSKIVNVKNI